MKEVLTKEFWQGVKKTFEEARDGTAVKADGPSPPAERRPSDDSPAEALTPPKDLNNPADIEENQRSLEPKTSEAP
jgi:hypothetical protein